MEYHLENKIVLSDKSEFVNLYKWCLQEISPDGKKTGRDLIPWPWTVRFRSKSITLIDAIQVDDYGLGLDEEKPQTITKVRSIRADLDVDDYSYTDAPAIYMMGTERQIKSINLSIRTIENQSDNEFCISYGVPSYSYEVDFFDRTMEDHLEFYVYIKNDDFDRYCRLIETSSINGMYFTASKVDGFYSDWSPSISTDQIRVLTRGDEHSVENTAGKDIFPPRLGKVREFSLQFHKKLEFSKSST